MEEELLTLPEYPSSPPGFSGVRATRSLVLCVCFVDVVCPFVLFLSVIALSVLLRYTILITPLVSSSSSSNSTMCVGAIPKTSDLDRLPCHLK